MDYPSIPKYQAGGIDFNKQRENCVRGNCEDGTLRATKSKKSKGRKFKTKGLPKGTSYRSMMRKKRKEDKVEKKDLQNRKSSPRVANPRFL